MKSGLADFLSRPERVMNGVTRMMAEAEAPPRELLAARSELRSLNGARGASRSTTRAATCRRASSSIGAGSWRRASANWSHAPEGAAIEALRRDLLGILEKLRERISVGGDEDFELLLRAVDAQIATAEGATIRDADGLISRGSFAAIELASVRQLRNGEIAVIPFVIDVSFS